MPRLMSVVCFLFTTATMLFSQSNGVTFISNIDVPHGVSPQGTEYSGCWGWVSPEGKEYALLGTYTGTSIIDLNLETPAEIQFIPGPPATYAYREIKSYKHYAYIVSEGGWGVQIVDLSQLPDTAILVRTFTHSKSGKNIQRSHTVTLADGYLYLNGSATWSPGGAIIFSLKEDPTFPKYVGEYQPMYIHDSYVRNDTLFGAAIYGGGGLYIADVSDKANPVQLGKISYTGSGTHHAWASMDGRYAFSSDEIGSTAHNMKVWDLAALPASSLVAEYRAEPTSNIHNIHGRGNYVYASHYTAGMTVIDVHDPTNPVEVGRYDTYSGASGGYAGCWGVYPYLPSGRWLGSDMTRGLFVCTFDSLAPRRRPSLVFPSDGAVLDTVGATLRWTSAAEQSEDPHYYEVRIEGDGVDTSFATEDTSFSLPFISTLRANRPYSWFVMVRDEFSEVSSVDTMTVYFNILRSDVMYADLWNLVSVPVYVDTATTATLFPDAITDAYEFVSGEGYQPRTSLERGKAYWLKFPEPRTVSITGNPVSSDSIEVTEGWNLIGSISDTIAVSAISSVPPGLVTSEFFKYERGYFSSAFIAPGRGYWVRVNQPGILVLNQEGAASSRRIKIESTRDRPPLPPDEAVVTEVRSVTPDRYRLEQNWPNPFNPQTSIRYSISEPQSVTLKIYDVTGREIVSLVNEMKEPGEYQARWTVTVEPSGVYWYRLTAGSFSAAKKMLLLR